VGVVFVCCVVLCCVLRLCYLGLCVFFVWLFFGSSERTGKDDEPIKDEAFAARLSDGSVSAGATKNVRSFKIIFSLLCFFLPFLFYSLFDDCVVSWRRLFLGASKA